MTGTSIVWLRRDLRLSDNVALEGAARARARIVCAFVLDPPLLRGPEIGAPIVCVFFDALTELRSALRIRGSDLALLEGDFANELTSLARRTGATRLYYNVDYVPSALERDAHVTAELERAGIAVEASLDHVYFGADDILKADGTPYTVFTPYKRSWLARHQTEPRPPVPSLGAIGHRLATRDAIGETLPVPEPEAYGRERSEHFPRGGEAVARNVLDAFVATSLAAYADRRNAPAITGTSHLSPQLRAGTIGIRTCVFAAQEARDNARGARATGYDTWISELVWRDFYQQIFKNFPHVAREPFLAAAQRLRFRESEADFAAWAQARTGYPIVDAAMTQLRTYGWMHNRLRMIVASFFTKDLLLAIVSASGFSNSISPIMKPQRITAAGNGRRRRARTRHRIFVSSIPSYRARNSTPTGRSSGRCCPHSRTCPVTPFTRPGRSRRSQRRRSASGSDAIIPNRSSITRWRAIVPSHSTRRYSARYAHDAGSWTDRRRKISFSLACHRREFVARRKSQLPFITRLRSRDAPFRPSKERTDGMNLPSNMSRGRFVGGTLAASALALSSAPYVIAAPMKELVVGLDLPQSGPYSDQGQDQLRAYNLAIEEINSAGGIMGMKVRATVGDDQTTPGPAVENARRMIERDGAVMITGGSSTGTAIQVSGLCQQKKTIFMATLTHGDETTDENCHKHTFRRYNDAHMSARAMATTLLSKYGTGRWFHITADYAWGHSVYENLISVLEPKGAKTVKNVLQKLGTTDFSQALGEAQAAKPDVLVITEFGKDMVNCLNQAAQFGLTKSTKILVPLADEYMAKGTGDNIDNVVTTAPFYYKYHAAKYPAAKKFVDAFRAKYGTPPSNGAECAYTNMFQYKSAVERAGSIDKLEGWKFTATTGQEYWRAWDHQGINSVLVMEGIPTKDRGGDVYAFAKVLDEHAGDSVAIQQSGSKCKIESA